MHWMDGLAYGGMIPKTRFTSTFCCERLQRKQEIMEMKEVESKMNVLSYTISFSVKQFFKAKVENCSLQTKIYVNEIMNS